MRAHSITVIVALMFASQSADAQARAARPVSTSAPATSMATSDSLQRGEFNVRHLVDGATHYDYQVFVPRAWNADAKWPVIVALHGSGERGSDNQKQLTNGMGPVVYERSPSFPAVVVFPQIPAVARGPAMSAIVMRMVDATIAEFNGDSDRVVLTGLSLGGILAYDMAFRFHGRFAALVPIAAIVNVPWTTGDTHAPADSAYALMAHALHDVPTWIFQGDGDYRISTPQVRRLVDVMRSSGVPVRYTEYKGESHDVWTRTYRMLDLYDWMLAQRRAHGTP